MSYALELLVSAVLLTNITQFGYWRTVARRAKGTTHWQRWGPVHLLWLATVMSLCQPMAVLLIYVGGVNYPKSKMWHSGSWWPNTPHGIFLLFLKYLGMALLTVGVVQVTDLKTKLMKKWREMRPVSDEVQP